MDNELFIWNSLQNTPFVLSGARSNALALGRVPQVRNEQDPTFPIGSDCARQILPFCPIGWPSSSPKLWHRIKSHRFILTSVSGPSINLIAAKLIVKITRQKSFEDSQLLKFLKSSYFSGLIVTASVLGKAPAWFRFNAPSAVNFKTSKKYIGLT